MRTPIKTHQGDEKWPFSVNKHRETSDPSGTAQNEQNNKPWMFPLVPGDQISDIIWRGSICLGVRYLIHAWTTYKCSVKISSQGPQN